MREFEWDEEKDEANWRKHSIRFKDARFVFGDPLARREPNHYEGNEERWQITGMIKANILLRVIFTTIQENGTEIIRIISARRLSRTEREDYEYS